MKNSMKINNISGAFTAVLFATVLSFGALGFAPAAHAQFDGGDYSGGCCDTGSYSTGTSYSYPADYSTPSYSTGTDYSYPADYSTPSYSTGTDYSYPADYSTPSYATPSYSTTGYGTTGYSTGGYTTGGYSTGGYSTGSGYMIGGGSAPSYSNTYAPTTVTTNTSVCSNGNNQCNTTVTNPAPIINNNNVVANYAQPVATSYPVQQYCNSGYSGTYPNCYLPQPVVYNSQPVQIPVAYNTAPYVSLTQVPYTGLDLGFWGSIAYWGAFVLFALFAAYLIAIKRVQNNIANYLKSVLFGTDEEVVVETTTDTDSAPAAPAPVVAAVTNGDQIDSFIMSQINRARHA